MKKLLERLLEKFGFIVFTKDEFIVLKKQMHNSSGDVYMTFGHFFSGNKEAETSAKTASESLNKLSEMFENKLNHKPNEIY